MGKSASPKGANEAPNRDSLAYHQFFCLYPSEIDLSKPDSNLVMSSISYPDPDADGRHFHFFAAPSGVKLYDSENLPKFHGFIMTLGDGKRLFCGCLSFSDLIHNSRYHSPKYLILTSFHPFFSSFRDALSELFWVTREPSAVPVERYVQFLFECVPLPPRGKLLVQVPFGNRSLFLFRPPTNSMPLLDLPLKKLFSCLSTKTIIFLFQLLILECKILIVSEKISLLTIICESLLSLLFPFSWSHVYIPVLAKPMLDVVHAPCPVLVGTTQELYDSMRDIPPDIAICLIDSDTVLFHETYVPLPPNKISKWILRLPDVFDPKNPDISMCDMAFQTDFRQYTSYEAASLINLENDQILDIQKSIRQTKRGLNKSNAVLLSSKIMLYLEAVFLSPYEKFSKPHFLWPKMSFQSQEYYNSLDSEDEDENQGASHSKSNFSNELPHVNSDPNLASLREGNQIIEDEPESENEISIPIIPRIDINPNNPEFYSQGISSPRSPKSKSFFSKAPKKSKLSSFLGKGGSKFMQKTKNMTFPTRSMEMEREFQDMEYRDVFLQFWVRFFKDFGSFGPSLNKIDPEAFISSLPSDSQPFAKAFFATQAWEQFSQRTSDSPFVLRLSEEIAVYKMKNNSTFKSVFLSDKSQDVTRIYKTRRIDTTNLPQSLFFYHSFPLSFSKILFGIPVKITPLVSGEDDSSLASDIQVQFKNLSYVKGIFSEKSEKQKKNKSRSFLGKMGKIGRRSRASSSTTLGSLDAGPPAFGLSVESAFVDPTTTGDAETLATRTSTASRFRASFDFSRKSLSLGGSENNISQSKSRYWWRENPASLETAENAVIILQKYWRMYSAQKYVNHLKSIRPSVPVLERFILTYLERKHFLQKKRASTMICSLSKRYLAHKKYLCLKRSTIVIQSCCRMYLARKRFLKLKRTVIILQSLARMHMARKRYFKLKHNTLRIQSYIRMYLARKRFLILKHNTIRIQSYARMYLARKRFLILKRVTIRIQSYARMKTIRKMYIKIRLSAILLQSLYRGNQVRRKILPGLMRDRYYSLIFKLSTLWCSKSVPYSNRFTFLKSISIYNLSFIDSLTPISSYSQIFESGYDPTQNSKLFLFPETLVIQSNSKSGGPSSPLVSNSTDTQSKTNTVPESAASADVGPFVASSSDSPVLLYSSEKSTIPAKSIQKLNHISCYHRLTGSKRLKQNIPLPQIQNPTLLADQDTESETSLVTHVPVETPVISESLSKVVKVKKLPYPYPSFKVLSMISKEIERLEGLSTNCSGLNDELLLITRHLRYFPTKEADRLSLSFKSKLRRLFSSRAKRLERGGPPGEFWDMWGIDKSAKRRKRSFLSLLTTNFDFAGTLQSSEKTTILNTLINNCISSIHIDSLPSHLLNLPPKLIFLIIIISTATRLVTPIPEDSVE